MNARPARVDMTATTMPAAVFHTLAAGVDVSKRIPNIAAPMSGKKVMPNSRWPLLMDGLPGAIVPVRIVD